MPIQGLISKPQGSRKTNRQQAHWLYRSMTMTRRPLTGISMTKDTQTVWQYQRAKSWPILSVQWFQIVVSWKMTEICICLESLESNHLIISWPHLQQKLTPSNQQITTHNYTETTKKTSPIVMLTKKKGGLWWVHCLLGKLASNVSYRYGCLVSKPPGYKYGPFPSSSHAWQNFPPALPLIYTYIVLLCSLSKPARQNPQQVEKYIYNQTNLVD